MQEINPVLGPKFGWSVKIELKKEEPCVPGSTCLKTSSNNFFNHYSRSSNYNNVLTATNRQTGEAFRSAAMPDCRIQYVC